MLWQDKEQHYLAQKCAKNIEIITGYLVANSQM